MKVHVLVEGTTDEKFFKGWLKRFVPQHTFKFHPHCGKGEIPKNPACEPESKHQGLLNQLTKKLRVFGEELNSDTERVLVIVDSDDADCFELKHKLIGLLNYCNQKPFVLFRIAIEETESFYLGDKKAIKKAFPEAQLNKMADYVQDSICGTWEFFQKVIGADIEDKPKWAEQMGKYMTTEWQENQSPSFHQFCKAVLKLVGEPY